MSIQNEEKFLHYLKNHPDWKRPQSKKWYSQLADEVGEYEYPWKSSYIPNIIKLRNRRQ